MRKFTRWDEQWDTRATNEVLLLLADRHLAAVKSGEKQATEIRTLVRERDIGGLCLYELNYTDLTAEDTIHLRQVLAFFQKREDVELGIDRQQVAWEKFVESETKCAESNDLFRRYFAGGFSFLPRVESVLFRAQRKISAVLGDVPELSQLRLRFGPGATTQVKKKDASARRKLAQTFASSEDAIRLLPEVLAEVPLWSGCPADQGVVSVPVEIHEGRISFVRKNAKTDRTIGVEPMLNSFVQLGIGSYIAQALRREGVDLTDQTRNQRLARTGSLTGEVATLDLSSASDLISNGVVESLLPYDWWDFLRTFRTGRFVTPKGVIRLEKFSSMGNGFTFPLESLIFYSLAWSCCDPRDHQSISVYGDDIIVPTYAYPLLVEVLNAVGFQVNASKSFSSGPFRESCGKDYLSGIDVRPCYIKAPLSGDTCFVLHNFYVRNWQPEFAQVLRECVDESLRWFGPDGYGDGHLLGDCALTPHRRELGWSGYTFETFTRKPRRAYYKLGADYVYPTYSIYLRDADLVPEEDTESYALKRRRTQLGIPFKRGTSKWHRQSGSLRPDRADASYVLRRTLDRKVKVLEDTLPGYSGYKRIKIYTLEPAS
jgi:hypothetical protein